MNKKLILALAITAISSASVQSQVVTFNYTGGVQTYTVPTCVFQLDVEVAGAEGGGASGSGGDGSLVTGTINVTPGQVLQIYVGNMGALTAGGFNGGGNGKPGAAASGGGGGSSDIRISPYGLADRIVIGGAGGGAGGGDTYAQGGSGGDPSGTTGTASYGAPGAGGTAGAGGAGGSPWGSCGQWGGNGALLNGGAGGTDVCYGLGPGGGGGGGRYGGGGGGSDDFPSYSLGGGGGGGGSSLVPAGGTGTTGTWTGNGYVKITPIGGGAPVVIAPAAPVICNGGSVVLTASGGTGTGWSWTAAPGLAGTPTTASVTVNPTSTQVYTVTETGTACPSSASVTVTVNPLPVATATPATSTICTGSTSAVSLSADIPGSTFTWTATMSNVTGASAGAGSSIAQTLTAVSAPGGSATYTITPTDPATGCVGAPITAIVNVEMPVISSVPTTPALCNGATNGTITINAVGVTQYSINGGATYFPSNVFTVGAGTYNISVISANGCVGTTTATVTEPAVLVAPMSFTDETCAGACDGIAGTAPGGGTAPYSYLWSTGGTTSFLGGLCSGTYNVTVTDFNGCTATGITTVSGPVVVAISSVTTTPPSCNGGTDGQIVINAAGGATLFSIDGGATFQASNTFTGLSAGTYVTSAADASGCTASMIATVNQPSMLTVTPSSPVTICQGQSTNIFATIGGATPPYTITWTDASAAVVGSTSSINVSPTTTGSNIYTVTVTDANGCGPIVASVNVTLRPPLAITAFNDISICPGASTSLGVLSATGGDGTYTYTWTNNVSGSSLFGADQVVTPTTGSTTYTVTLTDGCGTPAATDQMVVTWFTLPAVTYNVDEIEGCTPVVVNFQNTTNAGATATYAWNFGDGGTSTLQNPTHTFSGGGQYTISVTIITSDGCSVDTTINNQITVYDYPQPMFIHNPNPTDIFNTEVTFTNMTIGGFTYTWDFGGLGTSTVMNPTFTFPVDAGGVYNVCMNTVSAEGCAASICQDVIVNDVFLIYLPNTFTPDGDGINDIFIPVMQGFKSETFEFFIFDRWGEVVFKSTDVTQGWDGTHKAMKSKEDVYVWKIRVKKSATQEKVEYKGHVTLLR
ncbi:MAG TPA: PKD domain-containing protein [Flavobacteriales bacterium]|nr:PKD domain-containing protein [Flavobacteriales bacterium]